MFNSASVDGGDGGGVEGNAGSDGMDETAVPMMHLLRVLEEAPDAVVARRQRELQAAALPPPVTQ